jgi:predicted RNA-binding Zn ribbon-like protein
MDIRILPVRDAKLIGGRLCLDFTNTVGGRTESKILNEKIGGLESLFGWGVKAGILGKKLAGRLLEISKKHPQNSADVLKRTIKFRETLYRIFQTVIAHTSPRKEDLKLLNQELRAARSHESLERTKNGYRIKAETSDHDLDGMMWPVAISAAELLTEGNLQRLRQCDGENCGWLFLDTSKNNTRQWCDMSDCGNRAKVRRFRKRKH